MARSVFLLFLAVFLVLPVNAQVPKREFRGVWVATVANIDWPSRPGLDISVQKQEVLDILNKHKNLGSNAIILQVRPTADALYNSKLEPWSRFLNGEQGLAPEPYYDPLEFWAEECHKRGMELHAWLNPYRINLKLDDSLAASHIMHQHPEWTFTYGKRSYFSPANPAVWDFVTEVVMDVVRRYDIDAIHFDDYFYPYQIAGEELPDSADFINFGGAYYPDQLEDWRRHNVDTIIQMLGRAIKDTKPWVKFGISPFGVWRNRADDPIGSESTAGTTNYDGLYADVLLWQREGWIDYLMPQLYWRESHPAVGFSGLAYWWNDFSYGRALYVGLGPYRFDPKGERKEWKKEKYFFDMIERLRSLEGIDGFGYFSSKHFFRDDFKKLNKKLKKTYCSSPAIVPAMPWIDRVAPTAPQNLELTEGKLSWDADTASCEMDRARFYVIYRYEAGDNTKIKSPEHMIGVTGECFFPPQPEEALLPGIYRVSALDRLQNESLLSDALLIRK